MSIMGTNDEVDSIRTPETSPRPAPNRAEAGVADPPTFDPDAPTVARLHLDTRQPVVVSALIAANVLWFVAGAGAALRGGHSLRQYLSGNQSELLHQFGAVNGGDLLAGEWWRLLSCCFVHIGVIHIAVNMLALAMMGPLAELLWGRWRFVAIYFISGLAGSCLAMALQPEASLAGASGAIWGVFTSLLAWVLVFRSHLPPNLARHWLRRLGLLLAINAGVSFLPGISWEAHLGGGLAGFLAALLLNATRTPQATWRIVAGVLAAALPIACVAALVYATHHGKAWENFRYEIAAEAEAHARNEAILTSWRSFAQEVAPRMNQLSPEAVKAVELQAVALLMIPTERRSAETATEIKASLRKLKGVADEAVAAATPQSGLDPFEKKREHARAAAEARSQSFALLLAMLDSPGVPNNDAWSTWGQARRTATTHWEQYLN